jgi:hypothetical protein
LEAHIREAFYKDEKSSVRGERDVKERHKKRGQEMDFFYMGACIDDKTDKQVCLM